jgi:hypothetical protein
MHASDIDRRMSFSASGMSCIGSASLVALQVIFMIGTTGFIH